MIIITGGLGFIGSNILAEFNHLKKKNIIIVDSYANEKFKNIKNLKYSDFFDKNDFINNLKKNKFKNVTHIFHQGACTDTLETDEKYLFKNNFEYSKKLLQFCNNNLIKFIYASSASVYGNIKKKEPLTEISINKNLSNHYAYSKYLFDNYVLKNKKKLKGTIGMRYFNVYGINEFHKQNMSSPILKFYNQINNKNFCSIFGRYDGFQDGMHSRDFVYIDDVVKINLWAAKKNFVDIINVGTGSSTSFKDIALKIIKKLGRGSVKFIPFPNKLKKKYQTYTKADLSKLRYYGYKSMITNIDDGINLYLNKIKLNHDRL